MSSWEDVVGHLLDLIHYAHEKAGYEDDLWDTILGRYGDPTTVLDDESLEVDARFEALV